MGAMRVYRAPDGHLYQHREGHAPAGYVLVTREGEKPEPTPDETPKPKRRRTANKARKTTDK